MRRSRWCIQRPFALLKAGEACRKGQGGASGWLAAGGGCGGWRPGRSRNLKLGERGRGGMDKDMEEEEEEGWIKIGKKRR